MVITKNVKIRVACEILRNASQREHLLTTLPELFPGPPEKLGSWTAVNLAPEKRAQTVEHWRGCPICRSGAFGKHGATD